MSSSTCSAWACWTKGQQAGTLFAIVVAAVAIIGVLIWGLCCCRPRRRIKRVYRGRKDEEGQMMGKRGWLASILLGAWPEPEQRETPPRRGNHRRSPSSRSSATSCTSCFESRLARERGDPPMRNGFFEPSRHASTRRRHTDVNAPSPRASNVRGNVNRREFVAGAERRRRASMSPFSAWRTRIQVPEKNVNADCTNYREKQSKTQLSKGIPNEKRGQILSSRIWKRS
jgi:hypothetical protein